MEPIPVICGVFFFIIALFFLLNFWTNYLLAKEERSDFRTSNCKTDSVTLTVFENYSHFSIWPFSANFCPNKIDLCGNNV